VSKALEATAVVAPVAVALQAAAVQAAVVVVVVEVVEFMMAVVLPIPMVVVVPYGGGGVTNNDDGGGGGGDGGVIPSPCAEGSPINPTPQCARNTGNRQHTGNSTADEGNDPSYVHMQCWCQWSGV
jgi:hypothetical protein